MSLSGRIAVVTGASRGIGRAISGALAERGATLALLARTPEPLQRAAAEIGGGARAIPTDVADPASVRAAFAEIAQHFGRVDILVNNAGWSALGRVEELSDEEIQRTVGVNLLGPAYTTRSAVPLLRAAGGGDIVNISSESSSLPFPHLGLYAASKAGLEVFGRSCGQELRPDGVRVTTLVAGATVTGWGAHWGEERMRGFLESATASGHLAMISASSPQAASDVAEAVVFAVTRPRGQVIDVLHVRAHGGSGGDGG